MKEPKSNSFTKVFSFFELKEEEYTEVFSLRGGIQPIIDARTVGLEYFKANQRIIRNFFKFFTWFDDRIANDQIIKMGNRTFNVLKVVNVKEQSRYSMMIVEEELND